MVPPGSTRNSTAGVSPPYTRMMWLKGMERVRPVSGSVISTSRLSSVMSSF